MRPILVLILAAGCGGNAANKSDGGGSTNPDGNSSPMFSTALPTPPMPLISRGLPAFSSDGKSASAANDDQYSSGWSPISLPAWIAYDLSSVPDAQRHKALVSWYAIHAPCYIDTNSPTSGQRPIDYTIEINAAPGGANPPDMGWTQLISITANRYCGREHLLDLNGANWIRMSVEKGSADSPTVFFDLDVQSATSGASDAWLFMGDSITYETMTHAFCDLPELVHAAKPDYFPAVIDGALGGTNTGTAMAILDDTMMDFPGRFVVLAYGTNDHANEFQMETLVQMVIAVGKTPVVPHMPWSASSTEGPAINAQIDALYLKYPQIIKGPDLWAFFNGRTDLIPATDIHPNSAGQEALRMQWATTMEGIDQ